MTTNNTLTVYKKWDHLKAEVYYELHKGTYQFGTSSTSTLFQRLMDIVNDSEEDLVIKYSDDLYI